MKKFNQNHERTIRLIFEEKTGVDLAPAHKMHTRTNWKAVYAAAVLVAVMLTMVSCAYVVFSPLGGDELALSGSYAGNGVVEVTVTNGSEKHLWLQENVRLVSWAADGEEEIPHGEVHFEGNTSIAPSSSEIIRIDLSDAYDIPRLEQVENPKFYLLLTNKDFLFGHDWMCSFSFRASEPEPTEAREVVQSTEAENTEVAVSTEAESTKPIEINGTPFGVEPEIMENIAPELRFYFENAYNGESASKNELHFYYQEKVRELLLRTDKRIVQPAAPLLLVNKTPENVTFDETFPQDIQYQLVGQNHLALDGCGRMVGSLFSGGDSDRALMIQAMLPNYRGQTDGGVYLPLLYLFTYPRSEIQSNDDCAFIYGQLLTFDEMAPYKVYQDGEYVVYDMTHLFYTDLDAYIDYFITTRTDIYFDETIRQRVHNIFDYHRDYDILAPQFHYNTMEGEIPGHNDLLNSR